MASLIKFVPFEMKAVASRSFRCQSVRAIMLSKNSYSRSDVVERISSLHDAVQASNWGDCVNLVLNVPFWDAELEKVDHMVEPYHQDVEIGKKLRETHRLFDCLFISEDIRDHVNELIEVATRTSGLMGTGYMGSEGLENSQELIQNCVMAYEDLVDKYPEFKPKIEQSVGHGLAILRSKYKFDYPGMHRFFY